MSEFISGFFLGCLVATILVGSVAWWQVREFSYNSIEFRRELRSFYEQQNAFMLGMQRAGFLKIESPEPPIDKPYPIRPQQTTKEGRG